MAKYEDYGYSSAVPGSGSTSGPLAELVAKIVKQLTNVQDVCDLGCGNGYLAAKLADCGLRVTGVDGSASGIDVANTHYGSKVSFLCALIDENLPATVDDRFDLIVSNDVVEHFYRPSDLVSAANDLLRPDGFLIVVTPYHGYLKNLAISILDKWDAHHAPLWDGGHIKFFSVSTLSNLIKNQGFKIVDFKFYGRMPYLWKNMICIAKKCNKHE